MVTTSDLRMSQASLVDGVEKGYPLGIRLCTYAHG
jgi:hypothetical protein